MKGQERVKVVSKWCLVLIFNIKRQNNPTGISVCFNFRLKKADLRYYSELVKKKISDKLFIL